MTEPGLTIRDYMDDIRQRVTNGQKAMITYADWLKEQLAARRAQASLPWTTIDGRIIELSDMSNIARLEQEADMIEGLEAAR